MVSLAGDLPVVAVSFDDPRPLDGPGRRLVDVDRAVYRRLGMRRAPWWRVWSPGTLAFYARAGGGTGPDGRPLDTRQLGGDAVVAGGVAVRRWLPRTPVDRVAPEVVVAAARELEGRVPGQTDSM